MLKCRYTNIHFLSMFMFVYYMYIIYFGIFMPKTTIILHCRRIKTGKSLKHETIML